MGSVIPRDNSDIAGKVAVREWALKRAGGKKAKVLELFGGEGHMHQTCYQHVAKHMAFDIKPFNHPDWIQGNNRILLNGRAEGWTLYDADAFGNPWIVLNDVCRLRDPGAFTMVATCGCPRILAAGRPDGFTKQVINYVNMPDKCGTMLRFYSDIVSAYFTKWQRDYGVQLTASVRVRSRADTRSDVWYWAMSAVKKPLSKKISKE